MAARTYKLTYIFAEGRAGWTESWYFRSTSPLDVVISIATQVRTARALLLGKGTDIEAVRIVDVGEKRTVTPLVFDTSVVTTTLASDYPANCLLATAYADNGAKRTVYLRGCPDDWIFWSSDHRRVIASDDAYNAYRKFIKLISSLQIRMRTESTNTTGAAGLAIDTIGRDGGGRVTFSIAANTINPGDTFRVAQIVGGQGKVRKLLNKTHKAIVVAGDVVTVDTILTAEQVELFSKGRAWPRVTDFPVISTYVGSSVMRPTEKPVGRAFFSPRGRRRKRL